MSPLSCPRTPQLSPIKVLHLSGHLVTSAVLTVMIKKTLCSIAHAPGLSVYLKYEQRAVKELLHEYVTPDTRNK